MAILCGDGAAALSPDDLERWFLTADEAIGAHAIDPARKYLIDGRLLGYFRSSDQACVAASQYVLLLERELRSYQQAWLEQWVAEWRAEELPEHLWADDVVCDRCGAVPAVSVLPTRSALCFRHCGETLTLPGTHGRNATDGTDVR